MEGCIWCKLVKGEIPSLKIYEDEDSMAFLDINPSSPGHTIVIPKKHFQVLTEMPVEGAAKLFAVVSVLSKFIQSAMGADGLTIGANVGKVAGQEVPHVHIHIIPRFKDDKGGWVQQLVQIPVDKNSLPDYANKIISAINKTAPKSEEKKEESPKPAEKPKKRVKEYYPKRRVP